MMYLVQQIIVSFASMEMIQNDAKKKKINLPVSMEPFTTSLIQKVLLKKHPPPVLKMEGH